MASKYPTTGITLKQGDGASPEVFTAVAQVTAIDGFGIDREEIDVTGLSDTVRKFQTSLATMTPITLSLILDPDDPQHANFWTDVKTQNQSDRNYQIDLDLGVSPDTEYQFAAQVTSYTHEIAVGDVIRASITMRPQEIPTDV